MTTREDIIDIAAGIDWSGPTPPIEALERLVALLAERQAQRTPAAKPPTLWELGDELMDLARAIRKELRQLDIERR